MKRQAAKMRKPFGIVPFWECPLLYKFYKILYSFFPSVASVMEFPKKIPNSSILRRAAHGFQVDVLHLVGILMTHLSLSQVGHNLEAEKVHSNLNGFLHRLHHGGLWLRPTVYPIRNGMGFLKGYRTSAQRKPIRLWVKKVSL